MIVDAHVHLPGPDVEPARRRSLSSNLESMGRSLEDLPDLIVETMDREGVDRSLVLCNPWQTLMPRVGQHSTRFIPFAQVDFSGGQVASDAQGAIAAGYRGIGELAPAGDHFRPDDLERLGPTYALIEEAGMVLMWHLSNSYHSGRSLVEFGGPRPMQRLARAFPRLRHIVAHCGHPFEHAEYVNALVGYPNVYFDLSIWLEVTWKHLPPVAGTPAAARSFGLLWEQEGAWIPDALEESASIIRRVVSALPSRTLFASDAPFAGRPALLREATERALRHDQALLEMVMGGTAMSLFPESAP